MSKSVQVRMAINRYVSIGDRRLSTLLHEIQEPECHDPENVLPTFAERQRFKPLGEWQVILTLETSSEYGQNRIFNHDNCKISFVSNHETKTFLKMQCGLKIASNMIKQPMDILFTTLNWQAGPVYSNDIFIFSRSVEESLEHIQTVMGVV